MRSFSGGFSDFDADDFANAAAEALVRMLQWSIYGERLPASQKALALHAMLKGFVRVREDAILAGLAEELASKIDRSGKKRRMSEGEKVARSLARKPADRLAKLKARVEEVEASARLAPA